MNTKVALFGKREVRRIWHTNQWWFVVEDIVVVLTDSTNPKDYLNKMRRRDDELSKGYGQFVHTLPVETSGGRQRMNCANTEGIFRIKFTATEILQVFPNLKKMPKMVGLLQEEQGKI